MMMRAFIQSTSRILKQKQKPKARKCLSYVIRTIRPGRIFNQEDLKRLSDICAQNNVLIVADEIHGDLIRCNQVFTPIAKVAEDDRHIITFTRH